MKKIIYRVRVTTVQSSFDVGVFIKEEEAANWAKDFYDNFKVVKYEEVE